MATVATISRRRGGPDRFTVWLFTLAGFLIVLALMAWQLKAAPAVRGRPVVVLRRVYVTRVVETVVGGTRRGSSVSQSVSSSGSSAVASAPTTRTS